MADALNWLAVALLLVALVAAFGAISARSLFVACVHLIAAGASVAAIVLLLGGGDGAIAAALFTAAWAPVLLLAAMLLSSRAAKPARSSVMLPGWIAAALIAPLMWWPLGELGARLSERNETAVATSFWLAPLVLVLAAVCLGLLGYGERGAIADRDAQ